MLKKITKLTIVSATILPIIVATNQAYATTFNDDPISLNQRINADDYGKLSTMSYALSFQMYQWGDISYAEKLSGDETNPWGVSSDVYLVGINNDMSVTQTPSTVNSSTFNNSTTENQTFYTPSYTESYTDSVTATTTHAAKFGTKATAKIGLPMVGETSMEVSAEYTFTNSNSSTKTNTKSWTVPGQPIKVKPGHKIVANWVFYTGKATGTVKLQEKITATIPYKKNSSGTRTGKGLGDVVGNKDIFYNSYWNKYLTENRFNWERASQSVANHKIGEGNYKVSYGSGFFLEAHDLTDGTVTRIPGQLTVSQ
ncbi:ETX/MTX2 family pore-forming toxin [Enterococcus thailandicus]|uniref:Uncharacterized protein n=1 Tax=Enterococcus thailandicus TaxID=417368 RepID=A0A510WBU7_ENTTH|nr:ETX/MTX2 family pore-forming toxin [Enterococcus thailandicus]OJG95661.1 hypothetical protein RV17_GL001508 [Enterococcus thailandicus]GEK36672.1 hypothetical protein ETH01_09590 [Enterococcus thailandicus]